MTYDPNLYIPDYTGTDYRIFCPANNLPIDAQPLETWRDLILPVDGAAEIAGLLLSGDMQSGSDVLLLSGDAQSGTDRLVLADTSRFRLTFGDVSLQRGRVLVVGVETLPLASHPIGLNEGGSIQIDPAVLSLDFYPAGLFRGLQSAVPVLPLPLATSGVGLIRSWSLSIDTPALPLVFNDVVLTIGLRPALKLSGDVQSGGDVLLLSGDMQSATDRLLLSGT